MGQNSALAVYPLIEQSQMPPFSNEKYPLMPDEVKGKIPKHVIEGNIVERLEHLMKKSGLTYEEWAGRFDTTTETLRKYRREPCGMPREWVETICEMFDVTLDYLRGIVHWSDSTADMWSSEHVAYAYRALSDSQRRAVTTIIRDLVQCNYAVDKNEMMADAFERLLGKADE